jgi:hypothetical protein
VVEVALQCLSRPVDGTPPSSRSYRETRYFRDEQAHVEAPCRLFAHLFAHPHYRARWGDKQHRFGDADPLRSLGSARDSREVYGVSQMVQNSS